MKDARPSHIVFCAIAALVFAAAAWQAQGFRGTAQYFPLFAASAGLILALVAGALGTLSILRRRAEGGTAVAAAPAAEPVTGRLAAIWTALRDTPADQRDETLTGFAWLGIWVGFVLLVMVLGYLVGSAIWLGVWFRVVHKWPYRVVVPVMAAAVAALWAAQTYGNVHLPGGNGLLFSLFR